ncbi:ribosomal maturation YjgA family protein [Streptococcus oricebi]|uniref:DUF2809 domain-containing protein n=1 Tax=Streptococcus oricebi TaxID=1547447 RepID=A0ABS5B5J6_9STRE|nr:DUF2809 domain-containing protein [Streptococcus oricebi]MBP2623756.1 DUF2809 domain-containing protein [Streptococcus oricebi]
MKRIRRFCLAVLIILLGLLSRRISFLPAGIGDALWAATVFEAWGFLLPKLEGWRLALLALVSSWLVEFSQLLTWDWLVQLRTTTIGHLLLGQGFLVSDLLAYIIGVGLIWALEKELDRQAQKRELTHNSTKK